MLELLDRLGKYIAEKREYQFSSYSWKLNLKHTNFSDADF